MLIPPVIWRVVAAPGHFSKRLVPSVNWYNTIPVSAEWKVQQRALPAGTPAELSFRWLA